jgi:hypothetical protein
LLVPKKKSGMSLEEQGEKLREAVRELEPAGELSPIEAEQMLSRMVSGQKKP